MATKFSSVLPSLLISAAVSAASIGGYHWWQSSRIDARMRYAEGIPTRAVDFNPLDAGLPSFNVAAERTMHAVVHIKSKKTVTTQFYDPFFDFFGFRPQIQQGTQEATSTGSGVILSENGYIVTNNHVIADADELEVTLNDNRTYAAKIIGMDPSTDLGLIKIEERGLPSIELANSDEVRVGDWVIAVGNPFNLASTVTAGIVSAIGRDLEIIKDQKAIESFIQTDAAVNPGNSGGALVNLEGKLIGINTAISSPTGAYAGYAFAVPANMMRKIVTDLREFGTVQTPNLGISKYQNLDGKLAKEHDIPFTEGVYVAGFSDKSAAADGGIQLGDVIVAADEVVVKQEGKLREMIARHRPGETITLKIWRNGAYQTSKIKLRNQLGTTELIRVERNERLAELGIEVGDLSSQELGVYRLKGGAKITKLYAGKIRQTTQNLKAGFIVLRVDGVEIESGAAFTKILEQRNRKIKVEGFYPNYNLLYSYEIQL